MPDATASFMPATIAASRACAVVENVFSSGTVAPPRSRGRWRRNVLEPSVSGFFDFRRRLRDERLVLRAPGADRCGFGVRALRSLRQPEIVMAAEQRRRAFGGGRLEAGAI